MKRQNFDLGIN